MRLRVCPYVCLSACVCVGGHVCACECEGDLKGAALVFQENGVEIAAL